MRLHLTMLGIKAATRATSLLTCETLMIVLFSFEEASQVSYSTMMFNPSAKISMPSKNILCKLVNFSFDPTLKAVINSNRSIYKTLILVWIYTIMLKTSRLEASNNDNLHNMAKKDSSATSIARTLVRLPMTYPRELYYDFSSFSFGEPWDVIFDS